MGTGAVFALVLLGIGTMISALVSLLTYFQLMKVNTSVEDVHEATNGMKAKLELVARKEGYKDGHDAAELEDKTSSDG